jgi:hypothetical protein
VEGVGGTFVILAILFLNAATLCGRAFMSADNSWRHSKAGRPCVTFSTTAVSDGNTRFQLVPGIILMVSVRGQIAADSMVIWNRV